MQCSQEETLCTKVNNIYLDYKFSKERSANLTSKSVSKEVTVRIHYSQNECCFMSSG